MISSACWFSAMSMPRKKCRLQQEMRRIDSSETMMKFDELENRIERMEAEADLVNYGKKTSLEDELERLSVDDEIESELQALKTPAVQKMIRLNKTSSEFKGSYAPGFKAGDSRLETLNIKYLNL